MGVAGGDAQWECQLSRRGDSGSARFHRSPRAFTDRPDTAGGLADVLVPGSAVALVPDPAVAETLPNWPGACGKTQIAVMIAESLWRSRGIDGLIWISATNRAAILSGFVEASVAATGLEPTGTADSVAVRFVSWLGDDQAALARGPRRPAGDRRPERTVARRAGGPAADHQPTACSRPRPPRDAGHPGRVLQHPGGAERPVRTAQREPGPAPGRHRPGRDARPRAAGPRPGFRGGRELQPDLPGLPGTFRPAAGSDLDQR